MRYMTIYKTAETATPPSQEIQVAMGKFIQELAQSAPSPRARSWSPATRSSK
jgi:hypothetical protein